jgi:hypothetical protein
MSATVELYNKIKLEIVSFKTLRDLIEFLGLFVFLEIL